MLKLTVVLPNFNHARYLTECLEAILSQSRSADELIIFDDASNDDSVAVILSLLDRHPNARLIRNVTNQGANRNVNRGLEMATGDVVCCAAADDILSHDLFAIGMAQLEAHPQAAFFTARSRIIDSEGRDQGMLATPIPLSEPGFIDPAAARVLLMRDDMWFMGNTTIYRR